MSEKDREDEEQRIRVTDRRRVRPHVERDQPQTEDDAATTEAPGGGSAPPPEAAAGDAGPSGPSGASELDDARRQSAEYLEHLQRVTADFDNARKRMVKDQTRAVEMASERLIFQLLDALDEFQLAMVHADGAPEEFRPYLRGFELVYAKVFDVLKADGLEQIDAIGQPFDPTLHEALLQTGVGDGHPVVAEVFRNGYTFKGKVLRPAGVRVHVQEE